MWFTILYASIVNGCLAWSGLSDRPLLWQGLAAFTFMLWLDIKFFDLTSAEQGVK
jgi:hypothetical protein